MEADEFDCVKTTFQGKCHTPVSRGGGVCFTITTFCDHDIGVVTR